MSSKVIWVILATVCIVPNICLGIEIDPGWAYHAAVSESSETVADGAIDGDALSGFLRVLAGQDTARVHIACFGSIAMPADTLMKMFEINGQGFVSHLNLIPANEEGEDSATVAVIRIDNVTACSLQVRELCGFPLVPIGPAFADSIFAGRMLRHKVGAIPDHYANGSFAAEQIIPFHSSFKFFLMRDNPTDTWAGSYSYQLTGIDDWGAYRHWHATARSDTAKVDSTVVLFDSGTISGSAVYMGTAVAARSVNVGDNINAGDIRYRYGTAAAEVGSSLLTWINGNAVNADTWTQTYQAHQYDRASLMGDYEGQYMRLGTALAGIYHWCRQPMYFENSRLRVSVGPIAAVGRMRAVSFWYSAN